MAVPPDSVPDLSRDVALCACHDKPAYWQKDKRTTAGGWWECSVKRNQWSRDRYDRDPIFRIERQMEVARYQRAQTLKRKREALYGQVSQ